MYTLIIMVKDGFNGVEELKQEAETDFIEKIRREVRRTLKHKKNKIVD